MTIGSWFGAWAPENLKQNINPWEIMWNPSGQYGFINLTLKSSDPPMERGIVENVASYGKQLGRNNEAVLVMLKHMPMATLDSKEQAAIDDFRIMTAEIRAWKNTRGLPSEENISRLIDAIEYLKHNDAASYQRITARLRTILNSDGQEST